MATSGRSGARPAAKSNPVAAAEPDYRSVQIVPKGEVACSAVLALGKSRFLAANPPRLPLDDCDAANCQCGYQRFDDRRSDLRRTADVSYDIISEVLTEDKRSPQARGRRRDE